MTKGIVFYLFGNGMDTMLPPAIYSLRDNYKGPIHFVCSDVSDWFKRGIAALPNCTWSEEVPNKYKMVPGRPRSYRPAIFCRKAYHHIADYPFDMNLYMDLDLLWQMPMDNHPIFDLCEQSGLVAVTQTAISGRFLENRRIAMNAILGMNMERLLWAHSGAICAMKNCEQAREWVRRIDIIRNYSGEYTKLKMYRSAEELPLSTMLTEGSVAGIAPEAICFPIGYKGIHKHIYPELAGLNVHGVGGSLVALKRYWNTYDCVLKCNYMDIDSILTDAIKERNEWQARTSIVL
jgi:hypothetical protein